MAGSSVLLIDMEGSGVNTAAVVVGKGEHWVCIEAIYKVIVVAGIPSLMVALAETVFYLICNVEFNGCGYGSVHIFSSSEDAVLKGLYGDIIKGPLVDDVVVVTSVDHVRGVGIEHREVSGQGVMGRGMSYVVEGSKSWQSGADLATGFVVEGGGVAVT